MIPLKTSENIWFSISSGIAMEYSEEMGQLEPWALVKIVSECKWLSWIGEDVIMDIKFKAKGK